MADDAKALIEGAVKHFIAEVPGARAAEAGRSGGTARPRRRPAVPPRAAADRRSPRAPAPDAKIRVEMQRAFFNVMAAEGKVPDWVEAFTYGQAKAAGPEQYIRLIQKVVEAQQEREQLKRAKRS